TALCYESSALIESIYENLSIPKYYLSFLFALLMRYIVQLVKADKYIDNRIMSSIGGGATDYLIAFGIASINLTIVANNLLPFIILIIFGIILSYFFYRFLSQYYLDRKSVV